MDKFKPKPGTVLRGSAPSGPPQRPNSQPIVPSKTWTERVYAWLADHWLAIIVGVGFICLAIVFRGSLLTFQRDLMETWQQGGKVQ